MTTNEIYITFELRWEAVSEMDPDSFHVVIDYLGLELLSNLLC